MKSPHRLATALILTLLLAGAASPQDRVFIAEYKFEDPALRAMDSLSNLS